MTTRGPFNPAAHEHLIALGYSYEQLPISDYYQDGGEGVLVFDDGYTMSVLSDGTNLW
jgi:hypothetical protein